MEGKAFGGGVDEVGIMPVFYSVGWLVSHHSVLFRLLFHILNLLIIPFFYISYYTIFKSISRRRGVGGKNLLSHRSRRPGMRISGRKLG